MSNDRNLSIETLPVELFHRIFDNLSLETILFSIRPVSQFFQSIVHTYDRYDLNLNLISKSLFHVLCRLINPSSVISLTLSNDLRTSNQIDLFISLVNIKQLTRLRSLTLLNINDPQLNFILNHINRNGLTSFSFKFKDFDVESTGKNTNLLSSTISQSTLRRLEFAIRSDKITNISWPLNCAVQYLTINDFIIIDDLCKILESFPYLNTLIIIEHFLISADENFSSLSFQQITSLTINQYSATIDELESFLLLTPSLTYLKFIDGHDMLDGKRWEQFIQRKLPQLDKFEFYFTKFMSSVIQPLTDLELILTSFQSSF